MVIAALLCFTDLASASPERSQEEGAESHQGGWLSLSPEAPAIISSHTLALRRTQPTPYPVTAEAGPGNGSGNMIPKKEILGPLNAQ